MFQGMAALVRVLRRVPPRTMLIVGLLLVTSGIALALILPSIILPLSTLLVLVGGLLLAYMGAEWRRRSSRPPSP